MTQEQPPTAVGQSVYKTVRPSRLCEQIVQQIEESILGGALKPGDQLPAERELAQQFGASRTAVRQALKCLREKGVLEAFSGKGTFVTDSTSQAVRRSLDWMTRIGQPAGFMHLVEQRQIREPENAALASTRMDDQLLTAMREADVTMVNHLHNADGYIEADLGFHLAMAEAACDPLVLSLLDYIVGLLREQGLWIFGVDGGPERGPFHHRRILEASEWPSPEVPGELMRPPLVAGAQGFHRRAVAEETVRPELLL